MTAKTTNEEKFSFNSSDLAPYQSEYLHGGRLAERWHTQRGHILGNALDATVDIINPYISQADEGGFHLSIFSAQEFCTELILFWMFKKLGLPSKAQEAWMSKCSCKIHRPIRSHQDINVAMVCNSFRMINGMAYARASFRISDEREGLFIVEQHGGFRY